MYIDRYVKFLTFAEVLMKIMKLEITARRRRIAEEIGDALKELGLTKKEFAARMHRQPSEVTRWMSGNHNFTSDLLEEMSIVLGRPISGSGDNVLDASSVVCGYNDGSDNESALGESSASVYLTNIQLPHSVYLSLSMSAKEKGETLREYVQDILCEKAAERRPTIFDFCGVFGEDFPDADEIRSYRTTNTFPEL